MRRILALILLCTLLSGCDPAHQGYVRLQYPIKPAQATGAITLPAKYITGALTVLDDVAKKNNFRNEHSSADAFQNGWLRNYSRSYARYPEQDMYSYVTLKAHLRQNEGQIEIVIWEFVASRESSFSKQLRLTLESRLKQRFPEANITSRP